MIPGYISEDRDKNLTTITGEAQLSEQSISTSSSWPKIYIGKLYKYAILNKHNKTKKRIKYSFTEV